MTKIFDTSSLLLYAEDIFENEEFFYITNISLTELEHIKISPNKDVSTKYAARQLLHMLDTNSNKYETLFYGPQFENWLYQNNIETNNDGKILATVYQFVINHPKDTVLFYTNDIALKKIAEQFLGKNNVLSLIDKDDYNGYASFYFNDIEMADFYSNPIKYGQELNINQYVNIYEKQSRERVDTLCWTGENFRQLKYKNFTSKQLGDVKPLKNDIYQAMVADSLINNQFTMIKGPAGAGKSHLALGYLFYLLEKGSIDKIIIFCNTVATKNSAKLGFYPGSKDEKLLDSQIGNFLASKLGNKIAVEQLIDSEKLILLPMSDIRGYDASGMNAGIYITEAQNLDVCLLKLALTRIGEDSILILDGDIQSQVDMSDYEGSNNGMRRASKIFRGQPFYGEITLQKIHRSKIAQIAEKM